MDKKTVVAILPQDAEESAAKKIEGACEYALESSHLRLLEINYSAEKPPRFNALDFDAALLWADVGYEWVDTLLDRELPMVNLTGLPKRHMCVVGIRSSEVFHIAAKHLEGLHCRDIAYMFRERPRNSIADFDMRELKRYFKGSETRLHFYEDRQTQTSKMERILAVDAETESQLMDFLRQLRLPAAIWTQDDQLGVIVCKLAKQFGLRVPEDVAVLSYWDTRLARFANPPLSVLPMAGRDQGFKALALLDHLLQGEAPPADGIHLLPPPALIARASTIGESPSDTSKMERAVQLIDKHACEGITVQEVANDLGLSRVVFTRKFGHAFGCSPVEAIQKKRLDRARDWLRSTNLPVSRIAQMCGFEHESSFYRFFERKLGFTPGEYRDSRNSGSFAETTS